MVTDKVSIDIDLDGIDETALGVNCGNTGCGYHIFSNLNHGGQKYLGNLFFHPKAITIEHEKNIIKTYIRLSADWGCNIFYAQNSQGFKRLKKECE